MTATSTPQTVADYEAIARQRMDPGAFDYYAGGAGDERTLAENARAFDRVWATPRVLVDVSHVDVATTVLGQRVSMPILLAPTAYHRLAHPEGEVATARGAGAAGALMAVSTMATRTLEDVAAAASGPLWFQLYVHPDRSISQHLVARAEAAGYGALVLTVDTPVLGNRERDVRNRFTLPADMPAANFVAAYPELARSGGADGRGTLISNAVTHLDSSLTWDAVGWLKSMTRMPVLMDGGVRRGSHVLKALALGARAVLIGRPYLWGLAANGDAGVRHVLELLKDELELAMALSGCPTIASIDRTLVRVA